MKIKLLYAMVVSCLSPLTDGETDVWQCTLKYDSVQTRRMESRGVACTRMMEKIQRNARAYTRIPQHASASIRSLLINLSQGHPSAKCEVLYLRIIIR
uniref:Uncharacterized protein n=1 Tax=Pararge aegeria TaxID=116150 RepID=S4NKV5_9NEOP